LIMGRIAVLGDPVPVQGWALAGLLIIPAGSASDVRAAWADLPPDVELVLVTMAAAQALRGETAARLTAVLP